MDEAEPTHLDEERRELRNMNRQAWKRLVDRGYTSDRKVRVDFVFITEKRASALKLKAFFETETDYEIKIINNDDEFEIDGQTSEIQLSLEALNQWTEWMVEEGRKCNCVFDGWTTPLSSKV